MKKAIAILMTVMLGVMIFSSASLALERYIDGGGYYVNRLESFDINGIDGKKVKTVELLAPDNPSVVW